MTAVQELAAEGLTSNVAGMLVFGHRLFVQDYWGEKPCPVPGIIVLGEKEMEPTPGWMEKRVHPTAPEEWQYIKLADIGGGTLPDEFGDMSRWGAFAGRREDCARLINVFPHCLVLSAPECEHSLKDYNWAMKNSLLRQLCTNTVPSSHMGSSSSSSGFSAGAARSTSSQSR